MRLTEMIEQLQQVLETGGDLQVFLMSEEDEFFSFKAVQKVEAVGIPIRDQETQVAALMIGPISFDPDDVYPHIPKPDLKVVRSEP